MTYSHLESVDLLKGVVFPMGKLLKLNEKDNVALVLEKYNIGDLIEEIEGNCVYTSISLSKGERVAICDIVSGEKLVQYGYEFAISKGIKKGELVTVENTITEVDISESRFEFNEEIKANFHN